MRRILVSMAIIGLGMLMPAAASANEQIDKQIAQQVSSRFNQQKQAGKLKGFQIDMQVENGAVVLTGQVSTPEQRYLVLDIARRVRGVRQVVNGIKVRPAEPSAVANVATQTPAHVVPIANTPIPMAAAPAMPQSVMARPVPQQPIAMTPPPSQYAPQPVPSAAIPSTAIPSNSAPAIGDQQIAQEITSKLKVQKQAGKLKGFGINMQVVNGSVWMKGRVATHEQLTLVLDIARRVDGVRQVVNELAISSAEISSQPPAMPAPKSNSVLKNMFKPGASQTAALPAATNVAHGSGVRQVAEEQPVAQPLVDNAPVSQRRLGLPPAVSQPAAVPQMAQRPTTSLIPTYQRPGGQRPLAFGPSSAAGNSNAAMMRQISQPMPGGHIPTHLPPSGVGVKPAQHDHPQMPAYAWPSYAPHPNYGGVNYPKQYSPTAWPFIGPFYPYPQVPLGWREVSLKWKDGWWMLDFHDRHRR